MVSGTSETDPWVDFEQLSPEGRRALRAYCASMGETEFLAHVGRFRFRLEAIPMADAQRRCMTATAELWDVWGDDFGTYHRWYMAGGTVPVHATRWPVIAAPDDEDEWLEDGWHRFHSYVEAGDRVIPALFLRRRVTTA
jgi:hypothetical protein